MFSAEHHLQPAAAKINWVGLFSASTNRSSAYPAEKDVNDPNCFMNLSEDELVIDWGAHNPLIA